MRRVAHRAARLDVCAQNSQSDQTAIALVLERRHSNTHSVTASMVRGSVLLSVLLEMITLEEIYLGKFPSPLGDGGQKDKKHNFWPRKLKPFNLRDFYTDSRLHNRNGTHTKGQKPHFDVIISDGTSHVGRQQQGSD